MTASLLSPTANPFHPGFASSPVAIFNDGVPSFVLNSEHEMLHGIQDDAIDECFPPDASEAAELDAADAFVESMAQLAYMEECEERARSSFCHIKKRWEVRRSMGLVGRPRRARHLVEPVDHQSMKQKQTRVIVARAHRLSADRRMNARDMHRTQSRNVANPRGGSNGRLSIHQPRKNS